MAQRHGLHLGVLEQLLPHGVFEIIAHGRKREVLARRAVGAALEADDPKPGLGQFAGENAAGKPDPDADRIDFLEHRGHCCISSRVAITRASSAYRAQFARPPWSSAS